MDNDGERSRSPGDSVSRQLQLCCDSLMQIASNLGGTRRPGTAASTTTSNGQLQTTGIDNNVQLNLPASSWIEEQSESAGPSSLFAIHRILFRGGSGAGSVRRRTQFHRQAPYLCTPQRTSQTWTHEFCLSDKNCRTTPQSKKQREALASFDLGESIISIGIRSSADDLHQMILSTFPKLSSCGGYELLRCYGNSRTLSLIEPPYTAAHLCSEVAQSRIYIRPLQTSIRWQSSNSEGTGGPTVVCFRCGETQPISSIRAHMQQCPELSDEDFDEIAPTQS